LSEFRLSGSTGKLLPLVERELRQCANHMPPRESGHTLQPQRSSNGSIPEAGDQEKSAGQNRAHFFALSSHLMRRFCSTTRGHNGVRNEVATWSMSISKVSFDHAGKSMS